MRKGLVALWIVVIATGCLRSGAVPCGDGRLCPAGTICADAIGRCVNEFQLAVCVDGQLAEGASCQASGVSDGVCRDGARDGQCVDCICVESECGDGFRVSSEICDGTELGARPSCSLNGFYDGEVTCSATCDYDTSTCTRSCGDGQLDVDVGELCDGTRPVKTCVGFGYDAGRIECTPGGCSPAFDACRLIGWSPSVQTNDELADVVVDGDDLFAIGSLFTTKHDLVVHHRVGGVWTRHASGLNVLPGKAWAPGDGSVDVIGATYGGPSITYSLVRFDGTAWSQSALPGAGVVWGTAPTDLWVFAGSTLRRGDGTVWQDTIVPNLQRAISVWGSSAQDVWVVSEGVSMPAQLLHFDGTAWMQIATPFPPRVVWGAGAGDLFVGGSGGVLRRAGSGWTNLGLANVLQIAGRSATDFVVAAGTTVQHHDGSGWVPIGSVLSDFPTFVTLAVGVAEVVVSSSATVYSYGGNDWRDVQLQGTLTSYLSSIYASPVGVFVVELGRGIHRVDVTPPSFLSLPGVVAVSGSGDQVIAVGQGAGGGGSAYKLVGGAWQPLAAPPENVVDVAVSTAGASFAVNGGGSIYRLTALGWVQSAVTTFGLTAIWCDAVVEGCVAVGDNGRVLGWDGQSWSPIEVGTTYGLNDVWGSSIDDIWIVGGHGTVVHRGPGGWSTVELRGDTTQLRSVAGTGPMDVFVAGVLGGIHHYDGIMFSPVRSLADENFRSLAATRQQVWFGSDSGTLHALARTETW
ncbi:MAG: hypothetical protein H0T79_12440 [Deltaproteobacteria bacterium]|nr:hypothetical protein [Deltaproteobacteria bacterium]